MKSDHVGAGVELCLVERSGLNDLFLAAGPGEDGGLDAQIDTCARVCREHEAAVVRMDLFGSSEALAGCRSRIDDAFGRVDWPVTAVTGEGCPGGGAAGLQVHAVSGARVETVVLGGRPVGRVFEDGFARYCMLGDVHADPGRAGRTGREAQARRTLENMERSLVLAGMTMKDVVRTWFFNSDILSWYDEFNAERRRFYEERGVLAGLLPASTGVGGDNPGGLALVSAALAVRSKPNSSGVTIRDVPSPMQCPARRYGSLFSRALEVDMPDRRFLIVSGTASIDADGKSVHPGDVNGQIALTLDVVRAVLESRGMQYSDCCRAVAYFKRPQDAPRLNRFLGEYDIPAGRLIAARNEICRDDLLFEVEVDAVKLFTTAPGTA
jgi:enamine deaminase RidA (YjgF/YER057c/UK114 family)